MALVSMKTGNDDYVDSGPNPYGYGLCIRLNDEQCAALGITEPLKAGSVVMLTAHAFVASATQSVEGDSDDAGPDVCMELQITDLSLGSTGKTDGERASLLYGD